MLGDDTLSSTSGKLGNLAADTRRTDGPGGTGTGGVGSESESKLLSRRAAMGDSASSYMDMDADELEERRDDVDRAETTDVRRGLDARRSMCEGGGVRGEVGVDAGSAAERPRPGARQRAVQLQNALRPPQTAPELAMPREGPRPGPVV
ncbi:hypothetical protein GGF31_001220 [Allomyces arbusculus]|nr:hypothetical protein GGF31_001220 [Allomyces arbusculus]